MMNDGRVSVDTDGITEYTPLRSVSMFGRTDLHNVLKEHPQYNSIRAGLEDSPPAAVCSCPLQRWPTAPRCAADSATGSELKKQS